MFHRSFPSESILLKKISFMDLLHEQQILNDLANDDFVRPAPAIRRLWPRGHTS